MLHIEFEMLVSLSSPQTRYGPVGPAYVRPLIHPAVERTIGCVDLDVGGRESAELAVGPVYKENLSGDRYHDQWSTDPILVRSAIADLLEHPDTKECLSFDVLKLVSEAVCKVGFQGDKYLLNPPKSVETVSGVIGQERDEALKEFFFVHTWQD